jgi:hypothetical protein
MDKKKVRIKQVLQQLKIVINNDLFITQGHSAYLGSATKTSTSAQPVLLIAEMRAREEKSNSGKITKKNVY